MKLKPLQLKPFFSSTFGRLLWLTIFGELYGTGGMSHIAMAWVRGFVGGHADEDDNH